MEAFEEHDKCVNNEGNGLGSDNNGGCYVPTMQCSSEMEMDEDNIDEYIFHQEDIWSQLEESFMYNDLSTDAINKMKREAYARGTTKRCWHVRKRRAGLKPRSEKGSRRMIPWDLWKPSTFIAFWEELSLIFSKFREADHSMNEDFADGESRNANDESNSRGGGAGEDSGHGSSIIVKLNSVIDLAKAPNQHFNE
ncbi:hypothetical protein Fot_29462 [Forsythia ovata]|uniref:Uncharacterized protein n=1 Tax=Forsythia ovata TaxID=205694 RepID=A0ABD1TRZ3_9LAMI